jgi:hypothetical protein
MAEQQADEQCHGSQFEGFRNRIGYTYSLYMTGVGAQQGDSGRTGHRVKSDHD